jgi:general stress protein YciG
MSTPYTGLNAGTTNAENPRVAAEEPKTAASEGLSLAPDRPPVSAHATGETGNEPKARRPRGFAAMDRKLVSEIARKGGKAAHTAGTAHEFTSDEAREAGRKGGRATHAKRVGEGATAGTAAPVAASEPQKE